jgi:DNA repair photolyase
MYTHGYLEDNDFFGSVYAKTNIIDVLEKELSAPDWKREIVNIGGVTDSYQPAEAHFQLMPDILRLMIKYKTPVIISSKSDLILRDFDLLDELSRVTLVNIAQTITVMDEEIRQKIEPDSTESLRRFEVLRTFKKTNASIGVHVMPIIPYITDSELNFDRLFAEAASVGADYLLPGTLYLRGKTRPYFFAFVKEQFPEQYEKLNFDLEGFKDNIKPDRTDEDLLFQVMLDLGILLSSKIEATTVGGQKVFDVAGGYLLACFDSNVTGAVITEIAKKQPYYAVFRDSSMAGDSVAANFEQIFATYSPSTVRRVL